MPNKATRIRRMTCKPPATERQRLEARCEQAANVIIARAYVHSLDNQKIHDEAKRIILEFVDESFTESQERVRKAESELAEVRKLYFEKRSELAKIKANPQVAKWLAISST